MKKIQGITADPHQFFTIFLPNGETFNLTLKYSPQQLGWFCGVGYKNFKVNSLRVTRSYNILSQFSNLLPFGLGCLTQTDREPFFDQDFSTGHGALVLLNRDDMDAIEDYLSEEI